MAKAKKSETGSKSTPKKAPAKKAAAKTTAKTSAAPAGQPMVDTNLAAQNVAKLMAAGVPHKAASPAGGNAPAQTESAMFKNLKQGLSKPHLTGLNGILDKS